MKLDVLSVLINNFKSIKRIEFHLDRPVGVHFLKGVNQVEPDLGSNGAGKSSLWDAICWCYYGKTPDGLRGPDLIPWGTDNKVKVSVLQQIGKDRFVITRTANPNSLLLDKETTQEEVERRLGMNFDTFTNTMLLGQGRPLFFDLTPTAKMQLFYDALDLERWERRSKEASKKTAALQSQVDEQSGRLSALTSQMRDVNDMLKDAKARLEEWEEKCQSEIENAEKQLKGLESLVKKSQKIYDGADLAYDSAQTEITPLEKQIDALYRDLNAKRAIANQLESKLDGIMNRISSVKESIERVKKSGKCPLCGSKLTTDKHMQELKRQLADLTKQVDIPATHAAKAAAVKAEGKVEHLTKALNQFRDKARENRDTMDKTGPLLQEAKATIKQLKKTLADYEVQRNPHREAVEQQRRRRDKLRNEIEEADRQWRIVGRKQKRTAFWIKGFKDVALHLIEDTLSELELASNIMLDQMGLSGWKLKYATDKETKTGTTKRGLTVTVLSPRNDKLVKWENWSGGEGQRLRLIGALALSEVLLARAGVEPTLEILDEPSQFLSAEGIEDLIDFLHDRALQLQRRIYFTDHNVISSSQFSSVVSIVKNKGGSVVGHSSV